MTLFQQADQLAGIGVVFIGIQHLHVTLATLTVDVGMNIQI